MEKDPEMIVLTNSPYNSEVPKSKLGKSFVTPTTLFYARNHACDFPQIKESEYVLQVVGLVERPLTFTLEDLKAKFTRVTITATIQCAGNRRTDLIKIAPLSGEISWQEQAIGNAQWTGVPLAEVLKAAGVLPSGKHVEFVGLDRISKEESDDTFGFGGSVELEKAMCEETILAFEMNGKPLEPMHGYPLRVIVPGYVAARSVKWVGTINVRDSPSENFYQAHSYKVFPPTVLDNNVDWTQGIMLGEFNVSSTILSPQEGQTIENSGTIDVSGWAYTGGNRTIVRVDVSGDGGNMWTPAELGEVKPFAWVLWKAKVPSSQGPLQIVSKAYDSACNSQPEDPKQIWNFKGYMNNSMSRVNILSVVSPKHVNAL